VLFGFGFFCGNLRHRESMNCSFTPADSAGKYIKECESFPLAGCRFRHTGLFLSGQPAFHPLQNRRVSSSISLVIFSVADRQEKMQ